MTPLLEALSISTVAALQRGLRGLAVFRGHGLADVLHEAADGALHGAVARCAVDSLTVALFGRW